MTWRAWRDGHLFRVSTESPPFRPVGEGLAQGRRLLLQTFTPRNIANQTTQSRVGTRKSAQYFRGSPQMATFNRAASAAFLTAGLMLAGCSGEGTDGLFTGSLASTAPQTAAAPEQKVDPVCVSLVSRIDTLRREGVGDKIEKAAAKRYKMTTADLGKADQLTKANAEFQMRCSTVAPAVNTAQAPAPAAKKTSAAAPQPSASP
jgi:hypothetical protein